MILKQTYFHPIISILIIWVIPFFIFFSTIYLCLKKLTSYEKENKELNHRISSLTNLQKKNELRSRDQLPKTDTQSKRKINNFKDTINANNLIQVYQKTDTQNIYSNNSDFNFLNKDISILLFNGELTNFSINNYAINNQTFSFTVSDSYLSISIDTCREKINTASLQVVYSDRTYPNSIIKSDKGQLYDLYIPTITSYQVIKSKLNPDLIAKISLSFDNQNESRKMKCSFEGELHIEYDQITILNGFLTWDTRKIPLSIQSISHTIKMY